MGKSENVALLSQDNQFDNELSLVDLIMFVRKNLRILLSSALIGGFLGLAITFSLPAQWEAKALIRVGQLGSVGSVGSVGIQIEPSLQVLDRIKNKSFQNDVLESLGVPLGDKNNKAIYFHDTLKAKLEKSLLVSLALRSASPDEARRNMNAVIKQLKNIHAKMAMPTLDRWHKELASIDYDLKKSSIELERLTKIQKKWSDSLDEKSFSQAILLSSILLAREEELRSLLERKRIFEEQLGPERTFDTDVLGQVEVSTNPVFPKKSLFVISGLLIGLFFGLLFSLKSTVSTRMSVSIKTD